MKPVLSPLADPMPTRQSLLARMKDWQDQKSWQDFFDTYWRLIYSMATRAGLTPAEAEEALQETVISVARRIGEFKNDPAFGSFKSWLLLITRRRIADQFRKRSPLPAATDARSGSARTALVERVPDPASLDLDAAWNEQWERNLLAAAIANVKHQISPKQFLLFHQQVVKEWPAGKVAQKYDVSLAQVYMAKYRVSGLIKREVRRLKRRVI